jgi:serine/threonine protein kinase
MTLHKRFDESVARHFLKQFAEGLKFLDSKGVVHRDLKPQNLLLSARELDATLKIADFGFARTLDSSRHMMNSVLGSPLYMSPELLAEQPYTKKSEMWSVGVIAYEMLYGTTPWPDVRTPAQLMQAHKQAINYPPTPAVSPACMALLRRLLQRDQMLRFSPAEFFASRFLNGFVSIQVRHVTSLRRATHCPSTDVDVPGDDACLVDDVAQLLETKLNIPLDQMLLIAGPPQRKLAGSYEDPMEWIELDDDVRWLPATPCTQRRSCTTTLCAALRLSPSCARRTRSRRTASST